LLGLLVFTLAYAACAADRTWSGASDNNWSTPANWGGAAPAAGDALFFAGTTRLTNTNDLPAGTAFSGIAYSAGAGAFTLSGNALSLDGNISNRSANTQVINLPMTLTAVRTIYGSNTDITVNGVLSGPGGLHLDSTNRTIRLAGDNTYEGPTTITNGTVQITHGNALGSTASGTRVYGRGPGSLKLSGGIVVAEPITMTGQILPWTATLIGSTGSNVISGVVYKELDGRYAVESGANTLVFAGGIKHVSGGQLALNPNPNARMIITGKPIELGSSANLLTELGGMVIFAVPGNTFTELKIANRSVVRTDVAGVFTGSSTLTIGGGWAPDAVLDLNGFDATFTSLQTDAMPVTPGYLAVTSAAPATLTINQSGSTRYAAALAGAVKLVKNGTGMLIISNVVSTTSGDITVNNGTLAVESGGFGSNAVSFVVNGGTLELRNGTALSDAAAVRVFEGAKIKIKAGVTESVDKLFIDGEQQAAGTWGATGSGAANLNDAIFTGTGQLSVSSSPSTAYTDVIWDAGAGADKSVSATTNWAGDAAPSYNGFERAAFPFGTTAVVDTAASFFKMTLSASNDFVLAAGAGVITNGGGGLKALVPTPTSRTYTLAEDIVFGDHQVWTVTSNWGGVTTLNVTGTLGDGEGAFDLTKKGTGVLILSGNNTYDGRTILPMQTNGYLVIKHANALGSTNGPTVIEDGGYIRIDGGAGSGLTIAEPLTMAGDQSLGWAGTLRSVTGSNIWSGKITSNGARLRCESGACFEIVGGVDGSSLVCSAYGSRWIRFTEKPITASALTSHTGDGGVILAVAGNTMSSFNACGDFVRIDVPNAWPRTMTLVQGDGGNSSSRLNLNGNDQTVGRWETQATSSSLRLLFSAAPCTLTVDQSANTLFNGSITGAVSIVKLGSGNLTLTNAFTKTYGGFIVSNGTLTVSNLGTFGPNSTNIVVAGSGTLLLSNSVAIADTAAVRMPAAGTATAKISLASGVNETVARLYYGNAMRRAGTYGSSASDAAVKDDTHFAGAGKLTVLFDDSGTLIRVQ
jgi:autotransporter-associated beta strand protein